MKLIEDILSQFEYVHLLKERARLLEKKMDEGTESWAGMESQLSNLKKEYDFLKEFNTSSVMKIADLNNEVKFLKSELEHLSATKTEAVIGKKQAEDRAEEYRNLFLEEKEKHHSSLELLADWMAQRVLGRQIFSHAPLLQPDKPVTRQHMPIRKSARQAVQEETAAFFRQGEARMRHEDNLPDEWEKDHPGEKFFAQAPEEIKKFFEDTLAGPNVAAINGTNQ